MKVAFIILSLNSNILATPPGEPKVFEKVEGTVLYAVWQSVRNVKELRIDEPIVIGRLPQLISKNPSWYVVIGNVKGLSESDKKIMTLAVSLDPLLPRMPDMSKFPKDAVLMEIRGGSKLIRSIGTAIELKNLSFQLFNDTSCGILIESVKIVEIQKTDNISPK